MGRKPAITPDHPTSREIARACLHETRDHAMARTPADLDIVLIALTGIGYALLDIADATRERNYLIADALKETPAGG